MLIILGCVIQLLALLTIVFAKQLLEMLQGITVTTQLRLSQATARMLLGVAIAWYAPSTRFPLVALIVGAGLVAEGIATLLISNSTAQSILNWVLRPGPNLFRAIGIAALLLGGFLSYAT